MINNKRDPLGETKDLAVRLGRVLREVSPLTFFLIASSFFGLLFVFITPPVAGLDEEQHFYRAYHVSDFNLRAEKINAPNVYGEKGTGYGGYLPKSVSDINKLRNSMNPDKSFRYGEVVNSLKVSLNPDDKMPVRFDNTAIYSPAAYLPQAFGFEVGKTVNASPVVLSYLGRLTGLIFWIAVMYMSIKITPIGKWIFVVLALNPASLFLASSLSSDSVSISLVALFVAVVLRLSIMKRRLPTKYYLATLGILIMIALLKNAYMPIVFLLLAVPSEVVSRRLKACAVLLSLTIGIAWNLSILPIANGIPDYFSIHQNISSSGQILSILKEPLHFMGVLLWNIFGMPSIVLSQDFAGLVSDTKLPFWLTMLWFGILALALLMKDPGDNINRTTHTRLRYVSVIVTITTVLAIILSLYIGWNEVGSRDIAGVQSRYFIPVSFLLIPAIAGLHSPLPKSKFGNYSLIIKSLLLVVLTVTTLTMIVRYTYGIS